MYVVLSDLRKYEGYSGLIANYRICETKKEVAEHVQNLYETFGEFNVENLMVFEVKKQIDCKVICNIDVEL